MNLVHEISTLVRDVLVLGAAADDFDENTGLLGSIPEFDSMAVVSIITALEDEYGFVIEDDEISADVFATVGTLAQFVDCKLA